MGFDQSKPSSSAGVVIVIVAAVLLVAILGVVAIAGAGLLMVGNSRNVAIEHGMVAELAAEQPSFVEPAAQRTVAAARIQSSNVVITPDPQLEIEVKLDREGNASIDGEGIGLDDLRSRLGKLKDELSNAYSVRINAHPECPVKLLIPVMDVCKAVGDVDFRVASSSGSGSSPDEGDTP